MSPLWIAWLLAASLVAADQPDLPHVLDAIGQTDGWTLEPGHTYTGEGIFDYMDGEGEIPRACGYRALLTGHLRHRSGTRFKAELFEMGNPANAYGLYSLWREPKDTRRKFSHNAVLTPYIAIAWKGALTLALRSEQEQPFDVEALAALCHSFDTAVTAVGELPDLLGCLPAAGQLGHSLRYLHGKFGLDTVWFHSANVLAVDADTEVAAADYGEPDGRALVVRYAKPELAAAALERWRADLHATAIPEGLTARDGDDTLAANVSGRLLGLVVTEAGAAPAAQRLTQLLASVAQPRPPASEE